MQTSYLQSNARWEFLLQNCPSLFHSHPLELVNVGLRNTISDPNLALQKFDRSKQ